MAVATVAILMEPVLQSLGCTIEIYLWQEVEYLPSGVGVACSTTGDEHTESSFPVLDASLQSEVGDVRVVGCLHAGVDGHLVLTRHCERILLGDETRGQLFHVWIDIKLFVGCQTAAVIYHHISYSVATATCAGDAHLLQFLQSRDGILDVNVVNLNLLSGGDVEVRGGELVTHESNLGKLLRGDETARTAKAQHVVLVLALLVDAHRHTVRLQLSCLYLARLELVDERLGVVQVSI